MDKERPKYRYKVELTFTFESECAASLFYHLPDGLDAFNLWSANIDQLGQINITPLAGEGGQEAKQ